MPAVTILFEKIGIVEVLSHFSQNIQMGPHMLGLPRLLAGVLVLLFVQKAAAVNCKLRSGSSCICDLDDGAGHLDLTPISKNNGQPL